MVTPHPAMKQRLWDDLLESRLLSKPMPIHWEETKEARCARKKVLASRSLHPLDTLDGWEPVTPHAALAVSSEHVYGGRQHSIRFTSPCKLEKWTGRVGRIYTVPKAFLHLPEENWENWNRLTAWVYPNMPGYRNVCVRLQLHNTGDHPVPDAFDRMGGHNLNLQNHAWNCIRFEIGDVPRDRVIGVSFDYDMVGHEPCANGQACWYIGSVEVEQVEEPDQFEGWNTAKGRIAYSHLGYQPGAEKTAIACNVDADTFTLEEPDTGSVLYTGAVHRVQTTTGSYDVMDFSDFRQECTCVLRAGSLCTQPFDISTVVWMDSIWKNLNFIFCQRCGFRVPGKHDACHTDQRTRHGDKEIIANGGWHDAADTNQQFQLTCEATHALFELAMRLEGQDDLLYRRVLDEAIWGLSYLVKGRFGDGWRTGPSSSAVWTDGIRGTCDDLTFDAVNTPLVNLHAASAEVIGYRALLKEDPVLADYALKCAREDFVFGADRLDDPAFEPVVFHPGKEPTFEPGHDKMVSRCLLASLAAFAAMELYEATGDESFAVRGAAYGDYVVSCQQRTVLPTEIGPLYGFFYRDPSHRTAVHYNHRSHEDKTALALIALCRQLPRHPNWMNWHSALVYYMSYVKKTMCAVAPYGMLPSGVYSLDEIDDRNTFGLMHPIFAIFSAEDAARQRALTFQGYTDQLETGIRLDDRRYLRRFPVWYSFRGNFHVQLSLGKGVSASSIYLNDLGLYNIAQEQLAWILGKNPFSESLMFGVGYDYQTQYAVLHGDTVGGLPVGMQSYEEGDAPFWPQANNATYREIWMGPPGKWMALMADAYLPGRLVGEADGEVVCLHRLTGMEYRLQPVDNRLNAALPAGEYLISAGGQQGKLTVVAGGHYDLRRALNPFHLEAKEEGESVRLVLEGRGRVQLHADNLLLEKEELELNGRTVVTGRILCADRPWAAALQCPQTGAAIASVHGA